MKHYSTMACNILVFASAVLIAIIGVMIGMEIDITSFIMHSIMILSGAVIALAIPIIMLEIKREWKS